MAEHFTGHTDPKQGAQKARQAAQTAENLVKGITQASDDRSRFGGHRDHFKAAPDASKSSASDQYTGGREPHGTAKASDGYGASTGTHTQGAKFDLSSSIDKSTVQEGNLPVGQRGMKTRTTGGGTMMTGDGSMLKDTMSQAFKTDSKFSASEQTSTPQVPEGNYNTGHVDMTSIANAAVETAKSQYSEADAYQAKQEVNKWEAISNLNQFGRSGAKFSVEDNIYGSVHNMRSGYKERFERFSVTTDEVNSVLGGKYITDANRTGNFMNDYRSNMHSLEEYLEARNINARALSVDEIFLAIQDQKFKSGLLHGKGVAIDKNMEAVLKEYAYMKSQKGLIDRMNGPGGAANTAKAWAKELYGDADAFKGAEVGKATIDTIKTTGWVVKGAAGAATTAAISATQAGQKFIVHANSGVAKLGARVTGDTSHWKAVDMATKNKIHAIDTGKRNAAKQKVRYAVKTDAKTKARDGIGYLVKRSGLADTKVGKAVSGLKKGMGAATGKARNKIMNNFLATALKKPFNGPCIPAGECI